MAGVTNKGKYMMMATYFRASTQPTGFYVALVTYATAPNASTNTLGQLHEMATGNGYNTAGGRYLARNATSFNFLYEDDVNNRSQIAIADITWTATGTFPKTGNGARWMVITDDNATRASRRVLGYWNLTTSRSMSTGDSLVVKNAQLLFLEA